MLRASCQDILEDESHSRRHENEREQSIWRINGPAVDQRPNSAQQRRKERRVMMKNWCMWWMHSMNRSALRQEQQAWIRFPIPNPITRPSVKKQENWPQISIQNVFIHSHQAFMYYIKAWTLYDFSRSFFFCSCVSKHQLSLFEGKQVGVCKYRKEVTNTRKTKTRQKNVAPTDLPAVQNNSQKWELRSFRPSCPSEQSCTRGHTHTHWA